MLILLVQGLRGWIYIILYAIKGGGWGRENSSAWDFARHQKYWRKERVVLLEASTYGPSFLCLSTIFELSMKKKSYM